MNRPTASYLPRTLEPVLSRTSKRFKGLLLTGMRQVGKSTLLENLSTAHPRACVRLDDYDELELARTAPKTFFRQHPLPLMIDECQLAPDLGLSAKALLDQSDERGLLWLTGSHKIGLQKAVAEALSGRVAYFELFPLSLYERFGKGLEQAPFLPSDTLKRGTLDPLDRETLWKIIWQGSWPEVIHDDPETRHAFYQSFLRTYIEKDIFATGLRQLDLFARFVTVLATRIGQEFAIGEVQNEVGISAPTAREWLNVALTTGIIYLLPPFFENVGKTLIKKPKLYFTDTGFAAWLCRSPSPEALQSAYNAGVFFENFVVMELLKSWVHNGKDPLFYFYRDAQKNEIDLLIREGDVYHPIEIKATDEPRRPMLKNFDVLKGDRFRRGPGALICTCVEQRYLTDDVITLPIWDI